VRRGRAAEFSHFGWSGEVPDPQDGETFRRSVLHWDCRFSNSHRALLSIYCELLRLRRELSPPALLEKTHCLETKAFEKPRALFLRRWSDKEQVLAIFNFDEADRSWHFRRPWADG
jgi:hypothetical protein